MLEMGQRIPSRPLNNQDLGCSQNPLPEQPAARQGQSLRQHQGPELQRLGAAKLFIHSHQIQWLLAIQEASVCMEQLSALLLFSLGKV